MGVEGLNGLRCTSLRLVTVALVACAACESSAPQPSPATPEGSARAAIERLVAARASGLYQAMGELIVPERSHEVVTTLLAVDEFLLANRRLCDYVRDEFALGLSQSIDQSRWGARLDVFSRYVELIDERIEGEVATVSFMIDGQVPVKRAHLVLRDGAWRYDPGPGYNPQLPAAFQRMARGLGEVLEELKDGRLPAEAIHADPPRLIEEVRVRLLPGIKMLPATPATQLGDD